MTQMPSRQRRHAKPDSVRARLAGFRAGWHHGSGAHWVPDSSRRLCCSADMVGRATLLLPVRSSGAAASAVAASISPRRSFSFSWRSGDRHRTSAHSTSAERAGGWRETP